MYFIWPNSGSAASDPVLSYLTPTGNLGFQVNSVAPLGSEFEAWGIAGLGDGGGAWASWWGNVGLAGSNIVVQQFLPDAGTVFDGGTQNGIQLAALPTTGDNPGVTLLGDGTGGVTAVWYAVAGGTGALYAQRLATDGGTLWGANPVLVSSAASTPQADDSYLLNFRLIAAPNGDPTVVWSGVSGGIYAEKIDLASGSKLWGSLSGGIKVSAVYQPAYMDVAYGTDDSAYVTYQDSLAHIYVKRIEPDGTLGGEVPDAGPLPDAGVDAGIDAGFDAGVDAGIDAGVDAGLDAGPEIDAGPDAGTVDAGPDAGTVDAGHVDAGLDAGEPVDAGQTPDAGNPTPDAGADGGTTVAAKSGCSCSSGDAGLSWSFALFLVAALRRRRANR
jgi:uncharacterized protein (TIGR03382 family)